MSTNPLTTYDFVPYVSNPYFASHPDRLATVAILNGLQPAPVERCRVLELGCASGGNLLPMAEAFPESRFVGIDLSERQIQEGQQAIAELGVRNLELRQMSITDVRADFGKFDYIICHGVYSWVPAGVQQHILAICRDNLAPEGIAYVSYNALPGWYTRSIIRDMMLYHARNTLNMAQKAREARAMLQFVASALAAEKSPYALTIKAELDAIKDCDDTYLLHDYLEENNRPCYFVQFAEQARIHGLRYVGEADPRAMIVDRALPPEAVAQLRELTTEPVHTEQYLDFVRNRTFRQTLLCHADRQPSATPQVGRLTKLWIASPVQPRSPFCDVQSPHPEEFVGHGGAVVTCGDPIVKAAFLELADAWPQALPFTELRALAHRRIQSGLIEDEATVAQDTQQLGEFLLQCYTTAYTNVIEIIPRRLPVAREAGERPRTWRLARWQARQGPRITTLRHGVVALGEFEREMVQHLDGEHDRTALVKILSELFHEGKMIVRQNDAEVKDPKVIEEFVREMLDRQLNQLLRWDVIMD